VSIVLPADLLQAEAQAQQAVAHALSREKGDRWSVSWRFEGLRILPVAFRFARALLNEGQTPILAWPDAGAAALARRDGGELADSCFALNDLASGRFKAREAALLIAVAPQPSDYDELETVCKGWNGAVVMLNGRLEDAAVGIGSVARARRRGFVSTWQVAYWLEPLPSAALLRSCPQDWALFRADPDGYRLVSSFEQRPDPEQVEQAINGEASDLGRQIGAMDRFLNDLRG